MADRIHSLKEDENLNQRWVDLLKLGNGGGDAKNNDLTDSNR